MSWPTVREALSYTVLADVGDDHADDYDLDAIAREMFVYVIPTDAWGHKLHSGAGYVMCCDLDHVHLPDPDAWYWAIIDRHQRDQSARQVRADGQG